MIFHMIAMRQAIGMTHLWGKYCALKERTLRIQSPRLQDR